MRSRHVGINWPVVPTGMWGLEADLSGGQWSVAYRVGGTAYRGALYDGDYAFDLLPFETFAQARTFEEGLEGAVDNFNLPEDEIEDIHRFDFASEEEYQAFIDGMDVGYGWSDSESVLVDPVTNFLLTLERQDIGRILRRIIGIDVAPVGPITFSDMEQLVGAVNQAKALYARFLWNASTEESYVMANETQFIAQMLAYRSSIGFRFASRRLDLIPTSFVPLSSGRSKQG